MGKISEELSRLYQANEKLTPELVVEAAKPKASPLHDRFEWDNKKAGHEFRLIQARTLLRVTVLNIGDKEQRLVHVPPVRRENEEASREGEYVIVDVLKDSEDQYRRALAEAMSNLDSAQRRVSELRDMKPEESDGRFAVALRSIEAAKMALAA
jgi:hypothetical protein